MGSIARADRFEQLFKALKKHYKPPVTPSDRKVLDHILYACCLQDASFEAADEAFAKLQQAYYDSNEIRVTTIAELSESLTSLPQAAAAASRIKKSLQSMFEARYSFDIDDLKKANLGKAVDEISGWQGVSKYVVAYVTQHAFGGHAIPVSNTILDVCHTLELITHAEVEKGILPGIERAIPKTKGIEFAALLHQFAVDYAANFKHPLVAATFKEMGMTTKPKAPPPPPAPPKKAVAEKASDTKPATSKGTKLKPPAEPTVPPERTTKAAVKPIAKTDKPPAKGAPSPTPPVARSAKMAAPAKGKPTPPEKPTKSGSKGAEPAPIAKKGKPVASKEGKGKAKGVEKAKSKPVPTKKPPTKKSSAAPAKANTKRPAAPAKSTAKRLPIKPATKKRTKPR